MIKRIFIAGPVSAISKREVLRNIKKANKIGKIISKNGDLVYIPQNHKQIFKSKNKDKEYSLKLSKSILKNWATHIFLIKGWKKSKGATEEYKFAIKNKIKIMKDD